MSVWRGLGKPVRYAALASGGLPVLAFPAPNLEVLAWIGLVPGLLIIRASPSAREAAVRGWWFGTGFMLAAHYWLIPNIGPALLLVAVLLGALWTGVGVSSWALLRPPVTARRAVAALVVVPSYWLIIEWVRSWQALGGPWALLGASQWQHPVVLALAAVGGVWLVSFALVAANTGLVIVLAARRTMIRLLGGAAICAVVAGGPAAFALSPPLHPQGHITLALVQPGIVPSPRLRLDASERMTAGLGPRHPGLIVWGESSVAYDLRRNPALLGQIQALSAAVGAQILVDQDTITAGRKSKVAVLVGPGGIAATYTKARLVPFGEYIPFRRQLGWLTTISRAAPVNMIPGDGAHVLTVTVPAGQRSLAGQPGPAQPSQPLQQLRPGQPRPPGYSLRIGVLICFEAAFPDMSRADARNGARLLVYQTSDSTFQRSWAPAQHASLAALRAAETGRPAVQAALTGVTAAFDAQGRLLSWLPTSRRGVPFVRLGLPPGGSLTLFDRFGDLVPWVAIGICVLAACLALNRPGGPQRLIGIMVEGNRRPAPSVSVSEAVSGSVRAPDPRNRAAGRRYPSGRPGSSGLHDTLPTRHGQRAFPKAARRTRVRDSDVTRTGRWQERTARGGRLAVTAICGILVLFATACQSSTTAQRAPLKSAPTVAKPAAQISITPGNGTRNARPGGGVTVTVSKGKLNSVRVTSGRATARGGFGSGNTVWQTRWPLHVGTRYTVVATAVGTDGKTVTSQSSFRTLTPSATIGASTLLGYQMTYGVGMPITITFSQPVTRKTAVEKAIDIKTSKPVVGSWYWDGSQTLEFRPVKYWPQHTEVSFVAHFDGLEVAPGVYGTANLSQSFKIGNSLIVVVSTRTHYMKVYYRNKRIGYWPVSTGRPGDDTANGTYLTLEKHNPTRMKGHGYNVLVPLAVRFTWSGNYIHWADWSVAEQGHINVSHGCVNISPAHAATYYKLARQGDPVTVVGSPVAGTWDDGWTAWFLTWRQLLKGSGTHRAVEAGPSGSKLVSPSTVSSPVAHSALRGPAPDNSQAK